MYPQMRVTEREDSISRQEVAAAYLLRVIESLSLESSGAVKPSASNLIRKGNIDYNKTYARNPHTNSKNQHTSAASTPKEKSVKGADEDNRSSIRANSAPRPRAVLSSPDNDGIIGYQNMRIQERRRSTKVQISSDSNVMANKHSPATGKRASFSVQGSNLKAHRINHRAEGHSFSLNIQNQPIAEISDLKQPQVYRNTPSKARYSTRLQRSPNSNNGYPKIKCTES